METSTGLTPRVHRYRGLHERVRAVLDDLDLTTAERRVIRLTVTGLREPAICERLRITASTLRTHKCNAYHKLGVTTQLEVVTCINRMALNRAHDEIERLRSGARRMVVRL